MEAHFLLRLTCMTVSLTVPDVYKRQAIEDAGGSGLNAVKSYYEDIAKAYLPDRRVGLMHGKLKPTEKAEVMDDFKSRCV